MKYSQTIAEKDLWSLDHLSKLTPEQKVYLYEMIDKVNEAWLPIEPTKRKKRIKGQAYVYIRYLQWYSWETYDKNVWNERLKGFDLSIFK